ncbi:MAG: hypothetical protein K2W99_07330, partial [Chthoniobacterales bacterium]|nr:hypothetical protein [Chthoniobacterales bacterium]
MKKLSLFLLLSACVLAPLHVSAMMKDKKEEHEKSGGSKETLERNSDEQLLQAQEKAAEKINNPVADNNTETEFKVFVEKEEMVEESTLKQAPDVNARLSSPSNDTDEESEKEDLSDLATLEQRFQEARDMIQLLENKNQRLTQEALENLFQQWAECQERYEQYLSAFLEKNNNLGLIAQQQNERIIAKLNELVQVTQRVLSDLEQALPVTTARSNNSAHQVAQPISWRELLDQKKTLFQTPRDKAVFWTGWNGGKDPTECNLAKAQQYAEEKGKFTLETTPGGKRLSAAYGWFDPTTHYEEREANALWRYASEHYLKQVAGHVISFILDKTHPKYNGASIYQTLERPLLKGKQTIFLSENIRTFPSADFLNERQKRELAKPASQAVLRHVHNWLGKAQAAWSGIDSLEKFTPENREAFLSNPDVNIRGRKTETEKQEEELNKLDLYLLGDYILEAQAIVQAWEPLYKGVRALSSNKIKEAKEEALTMKAALSRSKKIATLEEWKQEHEWLEEALHSLNYYIFKTYQESDNREAAWQWKKECLNQEPSIDDVPPLFIGAFLAQENSDTLIAAPSNLQKLAHWHSSSARTGNAKTTPPNIQAEEKQLFENLGQQALKMVEKPEEQTQFQKELWQQRLKNLTELQQTLEKNWAEKNSSFEATYQKHLKEIEEKTKALQALDQEHQRYEEKPKELRRKGKLLVETIADFPETRSSLEKRLEENEQELKKLNECMNLFQSEYPEKRKVLEEACNKSQKGLWNFLQEQDNEEREHQLQQQTSTTRLKIAQGLLSTEEQSELKELRKLHHQTISGWEAVEKSIQELLSKNNPTRKEYTPTLDQLEKMAGEIEGISKKEYQSKKAMTGASAIRATAAALRNWRTILEKLSTGTKEVQEFRPNQDAIKYAQKQIANYVTEINSQELEAIQEELILSATRTEQIAKWTKEFIAASQQQSTLSRKSSWIKTTSSDEPQGPILGIIPELKRAFSDIEEHLGENQEERLNNIENLFLEMREHLFLKIEKLLEKNKKSEEFYSLYEILSNALKEVKKKILQQELSEEHLRPLLSSLGEQAESLELQKENNEQQNEKIVHEQKQLLEQQAELKKEHEKVLELPQPLKLQNKVVSELEADTKPDLQNIKALEEKEKEQQQLILEDKSKRAPKINKELSSAVKIFHETQREAQKAGIQANITFFKAIDNQEFSSWKLAQEMAAITTEYWKEAVEKAPEFSLAAASERIQLKRDLPKAQTQQNLWEKKATFAAKKLSALNVHEQAVKEANNPTLMGFVVQSWEGLLQDHKTFFADSTKEITNQEHQAWQKEKEHLLRNHELSKEVLETLTQKVAEEKIPQEKRAPEKELLEQETTTALKQFEELLNDGSSLLYDDRPQVSLTSYKEKHQPFFKELRTVAEKQKRAYQDQEQREETPSLLHAWEKVLEMIPELEKNHREWKETFSAKEKGIVDANLMTAWSAFQEGMAHARGEKESAALWEKSGDLLRQVKTAWNQNEKTKAERLSKQAYTLGGWEGWPGAAYAYGKAREARAKGDELGNQEAVLWEESSAILKEQAAALGRGDKTQAERLRTQAYALTSSLSGSLLYCYGKAREARTRGDQLGNQETALWEESTAIWKEYAATLARGDETQAERLKKQALALGGWEKWPGAAYAYGKAREARAQGDELGNQEAALWEESAAIRKEQAAALARGDETQATRLSKQANALGGWEKMPGAAYAHGKAREARAKGDELVNQEAALWEESAAIYKEQSAALGRGDKTQAERLKKQVSALTSSWSDSRLYCYGKAREARAKGDELGNQEAALWEESAAIYKEQSAALGRGDETQAERLKKQVSALTSSSSGSPLYCYGEAREARAKGDELGKKEAALWEESAAIWKEQAAALARGDETQAERLKKQVSALTSRSSDSPLYCYGKAREVKAKRDELGNQEAALWEESAEIWKEYAAALGRGDETQAERLKKQVSALTSSSSGSPLYCYRKARVARAKGDELGKKEAALWEESAAISKEQAAALARGDEKQAERLKKQANALGGCEKWPGAAYAYGKVREAKAQGDELGNQEAALWEESAAIWKEQSAALAREDWTQAWRLREQALALGGCEWSPGAAYAYGKVREAKAKGDELGNQEAALWEESAAICKEQAAALGRGDETQAERLKKQVSALTSSSSGSPLYCYRKARVARAKRDELGNKEAALWEESAAIWKECAATLARGDETQAERLKKQALALGGWEWSPGAAYAYEKAREARAKGDELENQKAALWEESAAIYKEQSAALGRGDETQAERLKKQVSALTSSSSGSPLYCYRKARVARAKGDELGKKEAALWEESAAISKEQAAALARGDEKQAERLKKQALALCGCEWSPGAAYAYGKAREARARRDELGNKEAALWEESAAIWKEYAAALGRGDET